MTRTRQPDDAHSMRALAGKYMTFKLADEEYGLAILKVRELIGLMDITRVPQSHPCVRGVINLRGKVIPVVDLRMQFGMSPTESTPQTVIIVVQTETPTGPLTTGILVDEVLEVRAIDEAQVEPPPDVHSEGEDYILGVGKVEKRVLFLLDIDRVLATTAERRGVART